MDETIQWKWKNPMNPLVSLPEAKILDTAMENTSNPQWLTKLISNRELLVEHLTEYIVSPRQELLIKHLCESQGTGNKKADLQKVLQRIPMSMVEFFSIVKESRSAKSQFRTTQIIDIFRPKITKAVLEGALPEEVPCPACEGEGTTKKAKKSVECWKCKGSGIVTIQPEHERQITALQISGVLQKSGPGTVVNVNQAVDASFRSSPEFRRDTDKLMYAQVVDVAPVPEVSVQVLPLSSATTEQEKAEVSTPIELLPQANEKQPAEQEETRVTLVGRPLGKRGSSSV